MRLLPLIILSALLSAPLARAQDKVFDSHVHLWNGETSLREYQQQLKSAGRPSGDGLAAMWFGGPNQALVGDPAKIRAGNDSVVALAKQHPEVLPVATVHPYDGDAALTELARVAKLGVKVLKIHPHTQRFDPDDPRVLALVKRAGER